MREMKRLMEKEVFEKAPKWVLEAKSEDNYGIMFGDDIDSLATAMVLNEVFGWKINWFYDFHDIHVINESIPKNKRVGVDMALMFNEKVIDNHVTKISKDSPVNPNSFNMNNQYDVSGDNYTDKYAMSSLLTAWSAFGLPLPESDEGKKILIAIDSSFKGHYNKKFKSVHTEWLWRLGMEDYYTFLDEETNYNELDVTIREKYNLSGKIKMKNGILYTDIDLEGIARELGIKIELPIVQFKKIYSLKRRNITTSRKTNLKELGNVYSFALTYKNKARFTLI